MIDIKLLKDLYNFDDHFYSSTTTRICDDTTKTEFLCGCVVYHERDDSHEGHSSNEYEIDTSKCFFNHNKK